MLTGRQLFDGRSVIEICGHHLHTTPVPPSERLGKPVATDLERLVLQCLEKDPAARPKSAAELCAALDRCEGAFAWTQERARTWWREVGDSLRTKKAAARPTALGTTVSVAPARSTPKGNARNGDTLPAA